MVEISNNDELKSWLEGQKQPVHIAIATRAALRAFPFVAVTIAHKNKKFDAKTQGDSEKIRFLVPIDERDGFAAIILNHFNRSGW